MFSFYSTKILQEYGLSLNAASTSEWVTGGPIGSRSAVLVFKTSALARPVRDDEDEDSDEAHQPSTSSGEKCRFPPVIDATKNTSSGHDSTAIAKRLIAPHFDIHRKSPIKPCVSVSSSSENSISSACEDPSDLEADIVKAEKSTSVEKLSNRTNTIKSRFSSAEDGETELKAESPVNDNDPNDDADASFDEMPATLMKMTYRFTNTETKLLKRILFSHGLKEAKEYQKFNLLWTGLHMKPDILRSLLPYQRVNHFPR